MSAATGFPEPFCKYRNTTRTHPDAKVGDDAIIGGDSNFAISNRRRFSVKHNDRHTISWGSIDPADDSDASESMRRPSRSSLSRLMMNSNPDLQHEVPPLPISLRRGVSFAIAEDDEEDAGPSGMLSAAEIAEIAAGNGLEIHGDLSIVERRRRDGHHRIGSVDSEMSATSTDSYSEIHGSGDEGPDSVKHHPSKSRKKRSFFRLIRRVSSRGSLRREDSF